jgi:hypothetical protein
VIVEAILNSPGLATSRRNPREEKRARSTSRMEQKVRMTATTAMMIIKEVLTTV